MSILLETKNLKRYYGKGEVKAVDDITLQIKAGRSLALIGESGSGKTTFGKLIAGLETPTAGKIFFQGEEIQELSVKKMRRIRKDMQMVFQSSGGVFDPAYTIGESITEVLKNYEKLSVREYKKLVDNVLTRVGLGEEYGYRYARNLSGGQCQRANIARALVLRPKMVICDEPVSSLDYSIRKQILNLLKEMQKEFGITYLLITHDLSNVSYVCQEVAIMYAGQIVEMMDCTDDMKETALHPYSKLLFQSIPVQSPRDRKKLDECRSQGIGMTFSVGCNFQSRCEKCTERCRREKPLLKEIAAGHKVACHCYGEENKNTGEKR